MSGDATNDPAPRLFIDGGLGPSATHSSLMSLLLSTDDISAFLDELSELTTRVVDDPTSCGITSRVGDQAITVACSDERARAVDELQYSNGRGPCLEALETGTVVEVVDQENDDRWGEYAALALSQHVRSSLSVPLVVDDDVIGALNLYGYVAHQFSAEHRRHVEAFAAQVTGAIILLMRQTRQAQTQDQLEQALTSRTTIDHAIGVIMAQQRCTADEAFTVLRRHSQNNNRKLRDVAAEVITRVTGHPPAPEKPFRA